MKKMWLILFAIVLCAQGVDAASLTKPTTLAWDQDQADFVIPGGGTVPPIAGWKLYQKNSNTGTPIAVLNVPYDPANLATAVNPDGTRTYTYGPIPITRTGAGGTAAQVCFHVTALGNNSSPASETAASNTACTTFNLPADPILAPGIPRSLIIK